MYTGCWVDDGYIWGGSHPGRFWIDEGYIWGPKNSGKYYIDGGHIYGPQDSGRFWIDEDGYIHGPSKSLPWTRD